MPTSFVYVSQRKSLKHYEICFLFYRKNSFPSRDIQFFCIFLLPSYFSSRPWLNFRTSWLKINLKVYKIIMCLNWNFEFKNTNCLISSEIRSWLKKNLKVYDVIMCLNGDLKFKNKLFNILRSKEGVETWSVDRVLYCIWKSK